MRKLMLAMVACCGAWMAAFAAPAAAGEAPQGQLKILCVGDSITHGCGDPKPEKYFTSYRYPLWRKLLAAKIDFTFVGPKGGNFLGDCKFEKVDGKEFPNRHYAQFGIKASKVNEIIANDIKGVDFNVVIMQLGTNDRGAAKAPEICTSLAAIIGKLRAERPGVTVFLVGVPDDYPKELNREMQATAEKLNAKEAPVVFVPSPKGWLAKPDLKGADTLDWVHPNAQGNEKLAGAIFAALAKWYGWK